MKVWISGRLTHLTRLTMLQKGRTTNDHSLHRPMPRLFVRTTLAASAGLSAPVLAPKGPKPSNMMVKYGEQVVNSEQVAICIFPPICEKQTSPLQCLK